MKTPIRQLWRWLGLAFMVAMIATLAIVIRQQTGEIPQPSQVVQPGEAQTPEWTAEPGVTVESEVTAELPTPFWTPRPPPVEEWTELPPNYNSPRVSEFMNEAVQITTYPAFRRDVSVDGNYIMWTEEVEPLRFHLFVYDMAKRETRQITEQPNKIGDAVLSGKFIAGIEREKGWHEHEREPGEAWNEHIFIYDLVQEEKIVLSLEEINSPNKIDISGHVIVWKDSYLVEEDASLSGDDDERPIGSDDLVRVISTYDIQKKELIQRTLEEGAVAVRPITNGEWVVYFYFPEGFDRYNIPTVRAWNMHSGEVRDLGLANLSAMMDLSQGLPYTISKNKVMWRDLSTGQLRIYNLSSGEDHLFVELEPSRSIGIMKLYDDKYLHGYRNLFNINNGKHIPFFSPDSINSFPASVDSDSHTAVWIAHPNEQRDQSHVYISTPRRLP